MSTTKDWWPTSRLAQLAMAYKWMRKIVSAPSYWKIDQEDAQNFVALTHLAEESLKKLNDEETCNSVTKNRCKAAFRDLTISARYMKRRYFTIPPLSEDDLVSLGLKIPDKKPTPAGTPADLAMAEVEVTGRQKFLVKIVYIDNGADCPANHQFRVYHSILDSKEPAPAHPSELKESFFTRKKHFKMSFDPAESGKICHMAIQIENSEGKKGPWGPIVSTLIP